LIHYCCQTVSAINLFEAVSRIVTENVDQRKLKKTRFSMLLLNQAFLKARGRFRRIPENKFWSADDAV